MSRPKDQSADPRAHDSGRSRRRKKRASAPALAPLEGRRLMSADVGAAIEPIAADAPVQLVRASDGASTTTLAAVNPTLSFEGEQVRVNSTYNVRWGTPSEPEITATRQ